MIYLASPYSADPEGNYARMVQVCRKILQRAPAPIMTPDSFQGRSLLLPADSVSSAPAELTTPIAGGSTEA
jgi:hypothetical protein